MESAKLQLVLSFVMFTLAAALLLAWPFSEPLEILHRGFPSALSLRGGLRLATELAAWLACCMCMLSMSRRANSLASSLRLTFTRYLLLVFLVFFAMEQLAGGALRRLQLPALAHRPQWIEIVSSLTVVLAGSVLLPRLRIIREGSAISRMEHARFLAAAESSLDDFYIFDGVLDTSGRTVDFRFSYINPNAERRLHVRREELVGKILTEVRPFMIASGLIEKYREVVRTGEPYTCEVFIDDEMIQATWLNVQVVKLGDGIAITSRDVTERRRLTDRVHHLAHHDQLTGLPNRMLLLDRLQQAIFRAQRHQQKIAVFMLDIDHFKRINDTLGHADGDALLMAVAQRLLSSVRETDTVARIGGDEFVIVMPDFHALEDVERCGRLIVENVAAPISIGGRVLHITVSIGVCICPDDGISTDDLLRRADAAMYTVKDAGRNGLRLFHDSVLAGGIENDQYR